MRSLARHQHLPAHLEATLVDEAILRQWLVNVGRKEAYAAVAHLLCELHQRLQIVGLAEGDSFELPLTQQDLADATGITNVHINRVLRRLLENGLVEQKRGMLRIQELACPVKIMVPIRCGGPRHRSSTRRREIFVRSRYCWGTQRLKARSDILGWMWKTH
ncbi:winged helix-turn-helix domain-containing protein [Sphingomonadales bacterium 56]|nr:winged helix-turn-helix domain-containing protein [Sphingomonadales bacterium 56]MBY2958995.1 winged helix-turn-helix domain-containing protein [Sphingomonadales bacterium 58]